MKSARRLVLKKESLTDLTTAELGSVAAGAVTQICPTNYCYSGTCKISELIYPCLTN